MAREQFLLERGIQAIYYPRGQHSAVESLLIALGGRLRPKEAVSAYAETAEGDMLRRSELSKDDISAGEAVKPAHADEIVAALTNGKSVAVQGAPGSGKSALGAWVNWLAERGNQAVWAFFGRELQGLPPATACDQLAGTPSSLDFSPVGS